MTRAVRGRARRVAKIFLSLIVAASSLLLCRPVSAGDIPTFVVFYD